MESHTTKNPITDLVKSDDSKTENDEQSVRDKHFSKSSKDRSGHRFGKKDRHDRHGDRFNHRRGHWNTTRRFNDGDSHIKYQPKVGKEQTLDLQIYAGSEIRSNGLYPISGKDLPKKDISINWFKEIPATRMVP